MSRPSTWDIQDAHAEIQTALETVGKLVERFIEFDDEHNDGIASDTLSDLRVAQAPTTPSLKSKPKKGGK